MAASTTSPVSTTSASDMERFTTIRAPTLPFDIDIHAMTIGMMERFSFSWSRSVVRFGEKKRFIALTAEYNALKDQAAKLAA